MRKIHLGAGGEKIVGWENYDIEVDMRKRLPFEDNSIDFIMTEHAVEHLYQHDVYKFFVECMRVLKSGGVLRVVIPDIKRTYENCDEYYKGFVKAYLKTEVTKRIAVEQLIFNFGHLSFWTADSLITTLTIVGFQTKIETYNKSSIPELNGIEQHWKPIGMTAAIIESTVVEATKL